MGQVDGLAHVGPRVDGPAMFQPDIAHFPLSHLGFQFSLKEKREREEKYLGIQITST
jgi:hypothetical protein